ncbi:MAG TPA: CPBP family intramembrane glutamic endopeptidase [Longimicrobiales bacterium]
MSRWLWAAALVLATAAAWVAARHLPVPARALTALLLVPLPVFMRWQARAAQATPTELVPRTGLYLGSALLLWTLTALTALAAEASGLGAARLGLATPAAGQFALYALAAYLGGVAILVLGRLLGVAETPMLRHLIPVTGLEKLSFSALSLTAGFSEELVFRGFLLWALLQASGSMAFAVALTSVLFGVLHAYQDLAGAARAAVLGLILALPVVVTGSVLPSMVAHAAIDLTSGLLLARWLLRR